MVENECARKKKIHICLLAIEFISHGCRSFATKLALANHVNKRKRGRERENMIFNCFQIATVFTWQTRAAQM